MSDVAGTVAAATAECDVDPVRNQINNCIVEQEFQANLRVSLQEGSDQPW